jgi:D-amino-acid dehydrogenase
LVDAAKACGVQFLTRQVRNRRSTASRWTPIKAPSSARQVLIACGAHSAKLTAALTGKKVPLDTERGYHLMLPHERERLPFAVTSLERKFIMTPMAGGFASPARWNSPASNVRPICNAPGSCIA